MLRPQLSIALLVVLAFALAAVSWWIWLRPDGEPAPIALVPGDAPVAQAPVDASAAGTAVAPPVAPPVGEREELPATDVIADGKARVRVTTRSAQGRVQPNVMVSAQPMRGNRVLPIVGKGLTDEHGRIEFADIEPCRLYLSTDRRDQKDVKLIAGLNEIDFEVKAGLDVLGRVLDPDGAPVAGAVIWLQTASNAWDGGRALGATGGDGTFSLADVAPNCSLGAFATGFAPSALVDLEVVDQRAPPARVELRVLRGGGDLIGRVTDRDGKPIKSAQVAVGDQSKRADFENDRFIEVWGVRSVTTDENGRYTIVGVAAGNNVLTARAPGFGISRKEAAVVAGATTTLDLTLAKCAVLFGKVTDKDGAPEVGAPVSAFDREPGTHFVAGGQIDFNLPFGHVESVADQNGEYRIEGVTPGRVWLFAQRRSDGRGGDSVALCRATLEIAAGSEVRWDPVIDDGRSVAGIVRYRDGFPIPHLFITLHDERSGETRTINSDKAGRYRFLGLDSSTYEVRVQPPFDAPRGNVPPRRSGIVPDQGPVEVTVEYDKPQKEVPGKVRGRIADVGARIRNPIAATVTLHSDEGWFRPGIKVVDGAFKVDEIKPCRFRIILKESETVLASTDWFELATAGDVDVGVLTTEPGGALRVRVARAKGAEEFEPKLYLRRDGDPMSTTIELGRADQGMAASLTPGAYEVSGYSKGMVSVRLRTIVRAGETAELQVELRPGANGKVEVWWPEGRAASKKRGYKLTDASGAVVQEYEGPLSTSPTRPYAMHFTLAAGQYHLEFWTDDGLRGELDFEIPVNLVAPELRLDLK